ncbi:MAG: hypothetical protein V3V00_15620 [Saprospiraceae bacterium]
MGVPKDFVEITNRLTRFYSKDPTEATNPSVQQLETNVNAIGNYTGGGVGTTEFFIQPPVGFIYHITRSLMRIRANAVLTSDEYTNAGALTFGIQFNIKSDTISGDQIVPIPLKTIGDFASYSHEVKPLENPSKSWSIEFNHMRGDSGVFLRGNTNDRIVIALADDFSSLLTHSAIAQGLIFQEDTNIRP